VATAWTVFVPILALSLVALVIENALRTAPAGSAAGRI
jgi:hypothetical protein